MDRLMRDLGLNGVRRGKHRAPRCRAKDGHRAGICWTASSLLQRPTASGSRTSPTCAPGPGSRYVAFIVDVFAQKIVAWHVVTDKRTGLVLTPLRMALWDRDRHGHPVQAGELVHHHDAGSQYTSIRFTEKFRASVEVVEVAHHHVVSQRRLVNLRVHKAQA